MDRALAIDAEIIGINNRNLHTFVVDLKTTEELAPEIPETVWESVKAGFEIEKMCR